MKYCSNCGNKVVFEKPQNDHIERFVCIECNMIHYENPKLIVGCIPIFDGKIMLCRRGIQPMANYWNLPAGFMENNETMQEGAMREVMEETGISVTIERLVTAFTVKHYHQVHMHFLAEMHNTNWNLTTESIEIKLFAIDEIPWNEIAFQSNTFTLKNYIAALGKEDYSLSFGESEYH
jgi:ADP-ribose pyrophosphatase YjhB (NUDIX family)